VGKPKGRRQLSRLGGDGRIILIKLLSSRTEEF
jgi:hypothetical protein